MRMDSNRLAPSMRKMMGATRCFRRTFAATLGEAVKDKKGRTHFMRAVIGENSGRDAGSGYSVKLTGSQGSGILMSMVEADGLMVMPAENDFLNEGARVRVQPLHGFGFQLAPGLDKKEGE